MDGEAFDYIIVGAGSAGCVLADRLTEDGRSSVLVLEYGGSDRSLFIQMPAALSIPMNSKTYNWGYRSEPEPHLGGRRIACPRGKVLGGSSSINGMVYVRGLGTLHAPRGPAACAQGHASAPTQARPGLGCCMHAQALAAACSPKPWMLRAHALAAECPWGAALALAAACPCLGCVPMGGCLHACPGLGCLPMGGCLGLGCCMPMPWLLHAHALAACPWGLPWPWLLHALGRHWASQGHARVQN